MAESALYNSLEKYNSTITNKFKDNWGTLLNYFEAKDTQILTDFSNNLQETDS